jgi:hypothetical protein
METVVTVLPKTSVLCLYLEENVAVSDKSTLTLKQTFGDLVRETVCGYLKEFPYLYFSFGGRGGRGNMCNHDNRHT